MPPQEAADWTKWAYSCNKVSEARRLISIAPCLLLFVADMTIRRDCIFCQNKEYSKSGSLTCKHKSDGSLRACCFRVHFLRTEKTDCPVCRRQLSLKDILVLAETKNEKLLMKSLLDRDEDAFLKALEVYMHWDFDSYEVTKLAFITSVAFGFLKATKKLYDQIFPRQSILKEFMQRFKKKKQEEDICKYSLVFSMQCEILRGAVMLKIGPEFKNIKASDIQTMALFCAVIDQNVSMVKLVLKFKDVNINYKDAQCYFPLYYSIAKGNLQIAKLLLDHKALIKMPPRYDALAFAAKHNRDQHYKLLCSYA